MNTITKLKQIISDDLDCIATDEESKIVFICENEKEESKLNIAIKETFGVEVDCILFEDLGELAYYIDSMRG